LDNFEEQEDRSVVPELTPLSLSKCVEGTSLSFMKNKAALAWFLVFDKNTTPSV
jgi:hypothetical protein